MLGSETPRRRDSDLLRRYVGPEWRSATGLLVLLLTSAGIGIANPRIVAEFVDAARAAEPLSGLRTLAVAFIVLAIVGQGAGVADTFLAQHLALSATNRLRADLTLHCLRLDLPFHSAHRPGELVQRVEGDVAALSNFLSRFLVAIAGNALLLAGVVVSVAFVDWRLGLTLAAVCIAVPTAGWRYRTVGRRYWEPFLEAQADQAGLLEELLSSTEDLRSAGATPWATRRFVEHDRVMLRRVQRASVLGGLVGTVGSYAFGLGGVVLLGVVTWLQQRGDASIGEVFLVFAYIEMLAEPIQAITREIQDVQTAGAAATRISFLLDTEPALVDDPSAPRLPHGPLAVELDRITFGYDRTAEAPPVLDGVSLDIPAERVVGLLGRTGSGKTTIARLLVRFYDPRSGVVSLAGRDIREVALSSVRSRVAMVTQEVQLLHASARDNLTLFDSTIDDARIVSILDDLGLDGWLASLPSGLDTVLTATVGLSGGEAQLLAFARVFLRDPGLVILDEATARLDPATERRVEHAVSELFAGRTAIVIAHRLQTVLRADDIVILDSGRVIEAGDRAALQNDPGSRFAQLLRTGLQEMLE